MTTTKQYDDLNRLTQISSATEWFSRLCIFKKPFVHAGFNRLNTNGHGQTRISSEPCLMIFSSVCIRSSKYHRRATSIRAR
jgi:hypothetical protein